jgi:hypothetical protein
MECALEQPRLPLGFGGGDSDLMGGDDKERWWHTTGDGAWGRGR